MFAQAQHMSEHGFKDHGKKKSDTHWNSRDNKLNWLTNLVENQGHLEMMDELNKEIAHREAEKQMFATVFEEQAGELVTQPRNFDCLRYMVDARESNCGKFSDFSLQFVRHLVHACETYAPHQIEASIKKMSEHCAANSALF